MTVPMDPDTANEAVKVTANTAVGAGGLAYSLFGLPWSTWVAIATIIYMSASTLVLLPKLAETLRKVLARLRSKHGEGNAGRAGDPARGGSTDSDESA